MAAIYARWIRAGRLTIEDVPERWREQTLKKLEQGSGKETL